MNEENVIIGIAQSSIRLATPYIYASLGETFSQLSGVLNLGIDGIMLMGAFTAYYLVIQTGSLFIGLLGAMIVGGVFGLLTAVVNVSMNSEQGISGIGFYLLGLGLSTFLFRVMLSSIKIINGFEPIPIPFLSQVPIIGPVFFQQNLLVYGAFFLVPIAWVVIYHTPLGLKVRAAGQNPESTDSLGVNVIRIRYIAVITGGVLAGVAGASLSIALLNIFKENITNGMGFIAVALVYFGGGRPLILLSGILLFSSVNALQMWAQVSQLTKIPADFTIMIPYIITIVVLASMRKRRSRTPAALNKPFSRDNQ